MTEQIIITDAEITAKAKDIAKRQLLDDRRKEADRQAQIAAEKKKKADEKAAKEALDLERQAYLQNLPQYFSERLEVAIVKNMELFVQTRELRFLDKLYKIALIKREILGGKN